MSHRRRVVNRRPACRLFATRTLIMCHMGCEQPLGRTARLRRWLAGRAAVCNPPPVSNSRRAILNGQKSSRNRAISLAIYESVSEMQGNLRRGAAGGFTPGPLVSRSRRADARRLREPAFPKRTSAPRPSHVGRLRFFQENHFPPCVTVSDMIYLHHAKERQGRRGGEGRVP